MNNSYQNKKRNVVTFNEQNLNLMTFKYLSKKLINTDLKKSRKGELWYCPSFFQKLMVELYPEHFTISTIVEKGKISLCNFIIPSTHFIMLFDETLIEPAVCVGSDLSVGIPSVSQICYKMPNTNHCHLLLISRDRLDFTDNNHLVFKMCDIQKIYKNRFGKFIIKIQTERR